MKNHFKCVLDYIRRTDHKYLALYCDGASSQPIPFFGNLESAMVVTVGLNPSRSEFDPHRGWPEAIEDMALEARLRNYFSPESRPHPFFIAWTGAFAHLDPCISYARGTAAHLDFSPRATDFPSNHQADNPNGQHWLDKFLEMLGEDIFWFFEALRKCKKAQLVMMAGTATKHFYLDQFASRHAPPKTCLKYDKRGEGKNVSFHRLVGLDLNLPVFFSGAGPAFRGGERLVENVRLNRDTLNSKLCK